MRLIITLLKHELETYLLVLISPVNASIIVHMYFQNGRVYGSCRFLVDRFVFLLCESLD